MKKILSFILAAAMLLSLVPASAESNVEYIPSPYTAADEATVTNTYFDPIVYTNENGPSVGATLVGFLKVDGLYFKDSDNDKELDVFEDWRLDVEVRTADLLTKMTDHQKAAYWLNAGWCYPVSKTVEEASDENGNIIPAKLIPHEDADNMETLYWAPESDLRIFEYDLRNGVYRGATNYTPGLVAAYNNALNQYSEFAALKNGETSIPFTLISNPISTGYTNYMALAAAVMGDVANGGDYSIVTEYATLDREMWVAQGLRQMYGPQIDIASDPRWVRNNTTYGEVPDVVAGITKALVEAYQEGPNGVGLNSVALSIKHFPGDGSAENGYESHSTQGQWRIYSTPGSFEKYQLVGFQAACDAGVGSIMPCYSRDTTDARSAVQTYRGVVIPADEVGSAYSYTMMQTLLTETMGFKGFINTDTGILESEIYGVEDLTVTERYAKLYNVGVDAGIAGVQDIALIMDALHTGLISKAALNECAGDRIKSFMAMGQFDNPYTSIENAETVFARNTTGEGVADKVYLSQLKSVVLLKNKGNVLPLNDTTKKIYITSFSGKGGDEKAVESLTAEFAAKGFTVVEDIEEADIAYLDVKPTYNGTQGSNQAMGVLDLVEELEVPELVKSSQQYTGEMIDVTTLEEVEEIAEIAEEMHAKGGVVIASITVDHPWILTNLEPHCDGLIANFEVATQPQVDVVTGAYNPTGKLPITMVSCNEVIAVEMKTLTDGNTYEVCVSPNDVPGYDKDQYIDPAILEKVPGGSYAYCDSEGNYYRAWFGLSY